MIIAGDAYLAPPLGKGSCSMGDAAIHISSGRLFGSPMHQDVECRVIKPTENICRKSSKRSWMNIKGLGFGTSSLSKLEQTGLMRKLQ